MKTEHFVILRTALIILAILAFLIPMIITTTGRPFSKTASHLFRSCSVLCLIGAIWSCSDWRSREKLPVRLGRTIGLLGTLLIMLLEI